nr:OmpA family protein [Enterovibrio nigricans]
MKTFMTFIAALLLAGCASQEVYTMQATSSQVHDLRDLDYDGVIEAREMCDDTILGASVDNDGCPNAKTVKQSFRIDVKFPNNSSELLPRHYSSLEQLAAFLDDQDGATVIIEGHASKTGNAGHNLMLSKDRAQASQMHSCTTSTFPQSVLKPLAMATQNL